MAKKTPSPVASICLYGNSNIGAGWLSEGSPELRGGRPFPGRRLFGDGTPRASRSFTEAVWLALEELRDAGLAHDAVVRIFEPGGLRYADYAGAPPSYGSISWTVIPELVGARS